MANYDRLKAAIEADRLDAKNTLKKNLPTALDSEMKAAMKAGDPDTAVALKKIIAAGGFDPTPVAPAPGDTAPNVASGKTPAAKPAPTSAEPGTGMPADPNNTPFGKRE